MSTYKNDIGDFVAVGKALFDLGKTGVKAGKTGVNKLKNKANKNNKETKEPINKSRICKCCGRNIYEYVVDGENRVKMKNLLDFMLCDIPEHVYENTADWLRINNICKFSEEDIIGEYSAIYYEFSKGDEFILCGPCGETIIKSFLQGVDDLAITTDVHSIYSRFG